MTTGRDRNSEELTEAGYLQQAIIGLIDVGLAVLLVSLILIYQTPGQLYQWMAPVNATLLILIWLVVYRMASFFLFNGTIGMRLFRVELRNGEQQKLTKPEKLLASFFVLYRGVAYYNR